MDAHSEEVCDILNDSLSSSRLHGLFRGAGDTSKYIDFTLVIVNQDGSHTTAFWHCSILTAFAVEIEKGKGVQAAERFAERAEIYVSSRLQVRIEKWTMRRVL